MAELKPKIIGQQDLKAEQAQKQPMDLATLEKKLFDQVNLDEEMQVFEAKELFRTAEDSRKRYDWEWLSRDLFRRGYQFTRYNQQTKTVTMSTTSSAKIPINLTWSAMRSIKNQVTAFRPKWEVLPNGTSDEAKKYARYAGDTLDYCFIINRLKKKLKETVMQGLLYSVGGSWQMVWNPDTLMDDGSKGFVDIWGHDPFDFYIDPNCTDGLAFTDAEYIFKAIRKPIAEVKTNPNYKNTELLTKGDPRVAQSVYKQFLMQALRWTYSSQAVPDKETVILKEGWIKKRDDKGKVKIRVITWVDGMIKPLRNELLDISDFPFRMYQADINPLEVYGESWARHVIPINRVINHLESSVFDYNYKYNKGRLVIDKNSGVRIVVNEHGSIIEKNRGAQVGTLPMQPLMPQNETQILRMRQYFEDISGAHDVTLGRIPVGVHSGIGIAELKQADATNQDDLVDNMEDFLVEVGKKILQTLAENIKTPRVVKSTNRIGDIEQFAIVGEKYATGRKETYKVGKNEYPLIVISPNNTIRVTIGSWLAYSKQQRQEELKNLYTTGVIDQRTLLEHLEFGDIDTIIKRTTQESVLKRYRETQKIGTSTVTEESIAEKENQMLADGNTEVVALPEDNHDLHIAIHQRISQNEFISDHIEQHKAYQKRELMMQVPENIQPNVNVPPEMAGLITPQLPPPPTSETLPLALEVQGATPPETMAGNPAGIIPV